jgi:predicted nucleic acid-binding protein
MTAEEANAVVVDTMVTSWLVDNDPLGLADTYRELIDGRTRLLSLQTLAEFRAGALESGWGSFRTRRLERALAPFDVTAPNEDTAQTYATLRAACRKIGHPLHQKIHDGDRWIAATAVHLGLPVVSHDGIFRDVPGLDLITALPAT